MNYHFRAYKISLKLFGVHSDVRRKISRSKGSFIFLGFVQGIITPGERIRISLRRW